VRRTTTPNLGYSGSVSGSLNDRPLRIARTQDELDAIRGAGVVIAPAKRRHTKGHATRVNSHGSRSIGLTDTRCYHADGTVTIIPRRKRTKRTTAPAPAPIIVGAPVRIRKRTLRATISAYVEVADRVGLNPHTVAALYRERAENGYHVVARAEVADHAAGWATDNR
jgi:hypothetical protein